MQWLAIALSFLFGRKSPRIKTFKEIAVEIFDELAIKSRPLITLALVALGAVLLLCGGLFIVILELTAQYDRIGHLSWSATLLGGMGLAFVSTFVFATIFLLAWPTPTITARFPLEEPLRTTPPLEIALSSLVMDYIKEREMRRETKPRPPPTEESPSAHRPPDSPPLHH
jgi:hypothetical protein